jgi:hypothetical protein
MVIYYVLKCGVGVPVSFIHYCVPLDTSVSDVPAFSLGFYSVVPSAALAWGPPPRHPPSPSGQGGGGGTGTPRQGCRVFLPKFRPFSLLCCADFFSFNTCFDTVVILGRLYCIVAEDCTWQIHFGIFTDS